MWVSVCVCVCEAGAGRERDRAHDLWSQKFFLWFDSTEGICMWFCQILGNTLNQIHDLGIWGHQIPAPNSCEDWLAVTNSHGDFCLLPTSHGWDWNFFLVTSLWTAAEIFPVYTSKELRSVVPALCSRLSDAAAAAAKSLQSCPTLCNPIDGSLPGSPIPGILQARTLKWVAISFSKSWKWSHSVVSDSSDPMDCSLPPPSMGFSRQEYWSRVPLPSPIWCYSYSICGLSFFPFNPVAY